MYRNRGRNFRRNYQQKLAGGQKAYVSQQAGGRTHSWTQVMSGTPSALTADNYFYINLLKFKRSFSTTVDDVPPVPTAGSNYQSPSVFNGSKIANFEATLRIENKGASEVAYLDVYECVYSFYDSYVANLQPAQNPVNFVTAVGTNDLRGEVNPFGPVATVFVDNTVKSQKFIQHYLRKIGTLEIKNLDNNNKVTIRLNRLPSKCRRSQTGMFYGLFFVNNSVLNGAVTHNLEASAEISFLEIPADERKPYLD